MRSKIGLLKQSKVTKGDVTYLGPPCCHKSNIGEEIDAYSSISCNYETVDIVICKIWTIIKPALKKLGC